MRFPNVQWKARVPHAAFLCRAAFCFLMIVSLLIASTRHQFKGLLKVDFIFRRSVTEVAIVLPYLSTNRSLVLDSISRWEHAGSPCINNYHVGLKAFVSKAKLYFYVDSPVTTEDHELMRSAIEILGTFSSCFSKIGLISADLSPEVDAYPAGPSVMFFKIFHEPKMQSELLTSSHMFWMEPDVSPLRPGWIEALLQEASKGGFWISGSTYLGQGLDRAAEVADNWKWIGHINGNALYNLKDVAFKEFLKLVEQYEPPNHFWKPFDVSIWRVIHAFPYTWPLYQKYRSKFMHSGFLNHWGFHASSRDLNLSLSRPNVYFAHGSRDSAGNLLLRPKTAPASVVWDDKVPASSRLSIFISTLTVDSSFSYEATLSAIKHVPEALEIVLIVPSKDLDRYLQRFNITGAASVRVYPDYSTIENYRIQEIWLNLHADRYCKGDVILHLDADAIFNRHLKTRDFLWLGKPMIAYQRLLSSQDMLRAELTSSALGASIQYDYTRSTLRCFPRTLHLTARTYFESIHNATITQDLLSTLVKQDESTNLTVFFSEFDYLGACAWKNATDAFSWIPIDPEDRKASLIPPPIIPSPVCPVQSRLVQTPEQGARLLQIARKVWSRGLPCRRIPKVA